MLFNSPEFLLFFLPITVLFYYWLNKHLSPLAAKIWLVATSLFFYAYWNPIYLVILLTSIVFNYSIGFVLQKRMSVEADGSNLFLNPKILLIIGIGLNISLLGYFKYADFFIANLNYLIDDDYSFLKLALPLAISFFTFQQIAYLIDSYKLETNEHSFLSYAQFVTFFPQLIAGPIVHHREMMPQFSRNQNQHVQWENVYQGLFIFSIGLFKKIVIADSFAGWANAGFNFEQSLGLLESWTTSLCYTMQLYYDFSGYSDMAIGAALFFNIKLPINFNSPYKALSIQEFWKRWHITLSRWLKDYIYIPLGGNRVSSMLTYQNLMVTFLLGGLWHGAGWSFVIWGLLHGLALVIQRIWKGTGIAIPKLFCWFITFMFVNVTWVFFRAETLSDAFRILMSMVGLNFDKLKWDNNSLESLFFAFGQVMKTGFQLGDRVLFSLLTYEYLVVFFLIAILMPNSLQMARFVKYEGMFQMRAGRVTSTVIVLLLSISLYVLLNMSNRVSEFIYFNF